MAEKTVMNWDKIDPLLGKHTDRELSGMFGGSYLSIKERRQKFGIPAFGKKHCDAILPLLGTIQDKELADRFGLSKSTVACRRKNLVICSVKARCLILAFDKPPQKIGHPIAQGLP